MKELKLYAWQPQGHGECSFFVMAVSKKDAIKAVDEHIKDIDEYYKGGWGTDYYELTVLDELEVIDNDNS